MAGAQPSTVRLVNEADFNAGLATKANTSHVHSYSDLTGTIPTSALPPLAINDTFVVASQAAMLALTAQRGDIAVRTDISKTYVLSADAPGTLANWIELSAASTGGVTSVAGKTGVVTLAIADVASLQTTLDGKALTSHTHTTANVTGLDTALAGKSATGHTHVVADTTGLQAALDGKQAAGSYAAASHTHTLSQLSDSSTYGRTLVQVADAAAGRTALGAASTSHSHATADVTGLDTALSGKAATVHTHTLSQVSDASAFGRQIAAVADGPATLTLIGAAAASHTHSTSNVTGLDTALGLKAPLASPTFTGTVAGITKAMVGLSNVDNTSDASKPVSTAQASAIALKVTLTELSNTNLSYAVASGLSTRPTVPTGMSVRVYGGTTSDTDPAWFIEGDYRDIPIA